MTNMRGWAPLVALLLVCLAPEGAQPARRQLQQREVGKLQGYLAILGGETLLRADTGYGYLLDLSGLDDTQRRVAQAGQQVEVHCWQSGPIAPWPPDPGETLRVSQLHPLQPSAPHPDDTTGSMDRSMGTASSWGPAARRLAQAQAPPAPLPPGLASPVEYYSEQHLSALRTNISAVFFLVSLCGAPPALTQTDLEALLFPPSLQIAPPLQSTLNLGSYFAACSAGQATLSRRNSLVVVNVTLPCGGMSLFGPWYANTCSTLDNFGWADAASDAAAAAGVDLSPYLHRVLVLPQGLRQSAGCTWAGLGTIGPAFVEQDGSYGYGYVWIPGESARYINAFFHELSHNLYLGHAGLYPAAMCPGAPCDASSAMGLCCNVRCHNAVHNWQLGWSAPRYTDVLWGDNFPPGATRQFVVPAAWSARLGSVVVVYPDWVPPPTGSSLRWTLFFSYRPRNSNAYDNDIAPSFSGGVLVHAWNGSGIYDGSTDNAFLARLIPDSAWSLWYETAFGTRLVVRALLANVTTATFSVCRQQEVCEVSCDDGLDNDCNGLTDDQDPACAIGCISPPSPPPYIPSYPDLPMFPQAPDQPLEPYPPPTPPGQPPQAPGTPGVPPPLSPPPGLPTHPATPPQSPPSPQLLATQQPSPQLPPPLAPPDQPGPPLMSSISTPSTSLMSTPRPPLIQLPPPPPPSLQPPLSPPALPSPPSSPLPLQPPPSSPGFPPHPPVVPSSPTPVPLPPLPPWPPPLLPSQPSTPSLSHPPPSLPNSPQVLPPPSYPSDLSSPIHPPLLPPYTPSPPFLTLPTTSPSSPAQSPPPAPLPTDASDHALVGVINSPPQDPPAEHSANRTLLAASVAPSLDAPEVSGIPADTHQVSSRVLALLKTQMSPDKNNKRFRRAIRQTGLKPWPTRLRVR